MRIENPIWLVLFVVALAALGYFVFTSFFSAPARKERRKRRSNRRLINTSPQPVAKFYTRTRKKRD